MRSLILLIVISSSIASASSSSQALNTSNWQCGNGETDSVWYIKRGVVALYNDSTYAYVCTNSIPYNYPLPTKWNVNPNKPYTQNTCYTIPLNPKYAANISTSSSVGATGLSTIGVLKNGVVIFNPYDGMTVSTVWKRYAYYWEGPSFDTYGGHPDPFGVYHLHLIKSVVGLYTNSSTVHSPLIGFALDGYPIYGPYGFSNATDSNSPIARMKTCYYQRTYLNNTRTTLFDGTPVNSSYYLPVNSTYPIGSIMDDWGCNTTNADLDLTNARYCVTPEYPEGTYAYFLPTDSSADFDYPLILGLYYRGVASLKRYYTNLTSTNTNSVLNTSKTILCSD